MSYSHDYILYQVVIFSISIRCCQGFSSWNTDLERLRRLIPCVFLTNLLFFWCNFILLIRSKHTHTLSFTLPHTLASGISFSMWNHTNIFPGGWKMHVPSLVQIRQSMEEPVRNIDVYFYIYRLTYEWTKVVQAVRPAFGGTEIFFTMCTNWLWGSLSLL